MLDLRISPVLDRRCCPACLKRGVKNSLKMCRIFRGFATWLLEVFCDCSFIILRPLNRDLVEVRHIRTFLGYFGFLDLILRLRYLSLTATKSKSFELYTRFSIVLEKRWDILFVSLTFGF